MKLLGKSLTCLLGIIFVFTACDDYIRFSYENYSCEPRQTVLYEISIGKLKRGAIANVQFASKSIKAEIVSLTQDEISMEGEGVRLIANRKTGSTQIVSGNIYETVSCVIDKFKM